MKVLCVKTCSMVLSRPLHCNNLGVVHTHTLKLSSVSYRSWCVRRINNISAVRSACVPGYLHLKKVARFTKVDKDGLRCGCPPARLSEHGLCDRGGGGAVSKDQSHGNGGDGGLW